MKKLLLSATALTLISVSALAADLPRRSAPAAIPAKAAPIFTWAGAYVGIHGGLASFKPSYADDFVLDAVPYSTNPSVSGGVFGGVAGYNFQSGNLVWGAEGDFGFGTHNKLADNDITKFTMPWNGHLRARLGYAMGQTLFFVAAGAAFAEFKVDDIEAGFGKFGQTRTGWTIGGGIEQAINKNWIVRAEYLYDRFGSKTSGISGNENGPDKSYNVRIKPSMHTVRAALVYKF